MMKDIVRMSKHSYFILRRLEIEVIKNTESEYSGESLEQKIYEQLNHVRGTLEDVFENLNLKTEFITAYKFEGNSPKTDNKSGFRLVKNINLDSMVGTIKESIEILNYLLNFSTHYNHPPVFMCLRSLKIQLLYRYSYKFYLAKLEDLESASRFSTSHVSDGIDEMIEEIDKNVVDRFDN